MSLSGPMSPSRTPCRHPKPRPAAGKVPAPAAPAAPAAPGSGATRPGPRAHRPSGAAL